MKANSLYEVFLELLRDIFSAENQIVAALPKMIQAASSTELKQALSKHLEETKNQVQRLNKIFKALNENPTGVTCKAMQGLVAEGEEVIAATSTTSPAVKDAALIIACQKIEHYEISSYGSARTLARHLGDSESHKNVDFDEVADTLQATLDEEAEADETLTELAEGGIFSSGINDEAEEQPGSKRSSENLNR